MPSYDPHPKANIMIGPTAITLIRSSNHAGNVRQWYAILQKPCSSAIEIPGVSIA